MRGRTLTARTGFPGPCPPQARLRRLKRQAPGSITTPGRQLPRLGCKHTAAGPIAGVLASLHHISSADAGLSSRSPQLAQPAQVCSRDPRSYSGQERSFSHGRGVSPHSSTSFLGLCSQRLRLFCLVGATSTLSPLRHFIEGLPGLKTG